MTLHKRILVADDDPRVLFILRTTLERMGNEIRIVAVRNGKEALKQVKDEPFDLVITDIRMPGVDGIELVEEIRALQTSTAVIWITAYGCHKLEADRDRLDVCRCLDKPLRIGQIRRAALEALGSDPGPEKTTE